MQRVLTLLQDEATLRSEDTVLRDATASLLACLLRLSDCSGGLATPAVRAEFVLVAMHVRASQCTAAAAAATELLRALHSSLQLPSTAAIVSTTGCFDALAAALPPPGQPRRWTAAPAFSARMLVVLLEHGEGLAPPQFELLVEQVGALSAHRVELATEVDVLGALCTMLVADTYAREVCSTLVTKRVLLPLLPCASGSIRRRALDVLLALCGDEGASRRELPVETALLLMQPGEGNGLASLLVPLEDAQAEVRRRGLLAVAAVFEVATPHLLTQQLAAEADGGAQAAARTVAALGERLTDSDDDVRLLACEVLVRVLQGLLPHRDRLELRALHREASAAAMQLEGDREGNGGAAAAPDGEQASLGCDVISRELVQVVRHNLQDGDARFVAANSQLADVLALFGVE
eukprot:scaffold1621_cov350-Prasinococcus_capsulatus_cf.AAC.12